VADRGMLTRYGGYWGNKIPGRNKTSTAAVQFGTGVSRARGRKNLDQKSPGPPGWGLTQQASPLLIEKKGIAKKPIRNTLDRCNLGRRKRGRPGRKGLQDCWGERD